MILSALCPLLCNSTRPQHTLQMFADHCGPRQTKPWETINQGLLQPQGELYPIQTIFNHRNRDQLLEFRTSFYETISSGFLVQGNFKHTQFSREHWHWRITNVSRTITFHLRNISRIRRFIEKNTCHHAVRSLILSRLDYCNGLLSSLPKSYTLRLQRLQNWAARLVFTVNRRHESVPLLKYLHWLPVNGLAPMYISDCLKLYVPDT